jgi:hypothetical protein
MATVAVPANTTVTLDPGTAYSVNVTNSGTEVLVLDGRQLMPGHRRMVYPAANEPVTVLSTTAIDGQVTVTVSGAGKGTVDGGTP